MLGYRDSGMPGTSRSRAEDQYERSPSVTIPIDPGLKTGYAHHAFAGAEHLEQQRTLTSILTVTYRVRR